MGLFGSSGIRQVIDKDFIQLALKVGLAVGNIYHNTAIACDTRTSSDAMKHAVISGLLVAGSKCYDAGIIPTPTLALATSNYDAAAMITASHNPPQYNGIKLINPDGSAFDSKQRAQIDEMVINTSFSGAVWNVIHNGGTYEEAIEQHIKRISRDFPGGSQGRIVLDCSCGAGATISPRVLQQLGYDVIDINCYPSGFFPHDVEPIEANLKDLIAATKHFDAIVGIAQDGDADRMMAVDDKGRFVPGDKLLAILAQGVEAKEIITTIDASMVMDDLGLSVKRTRIGDAYVSEELVNGGDFGGEPSGSWIFPNVSLCPDGVYAAALISHIASKNQLSTIVDEIPSYPILRGSIVDEGIVMTALEQRLMATDPISVSKIDGIRLGFEDGWLLIRCSGTEPKIRITAEAKIEIRTREIYDSAIKAISDCLA
ncbi:phosphopentomutase/phosphoglucosamine mutase [Chloroflexota bacterium]